VTDAEKVKALEGALSEYREMLESGGHIGAATFFLCVAVEDIIGGGAPLTVSVKKPNLDTGPAPSA
jgi:hypothetical protein